MSLDEYIQEVTAQWKSEIEKILVVKFDESFTGFDFI
jgi:hypothetical protein